MGFLAKKIKTRFEKPSSYLNPYIYTDESIMVLTLLLFSFSITLYTSQKY